MGQVQRRGETEVYEGLEVFNLSLSYRRDRAHYEMHIDDAPIVPRSERDAAALFTRLAEQLNGADIRSIVVMRLCSEISDLVDALSPDILRSVGRARDGRAALIAALLSSDTALDPLTASEVAGVDVAREMLQLEGGVWGIQRVADHLGISRQAVNQRVRRDHLLAVAPGKHLHRFPAWQFAEGGVLDGLEDVLAVLVAGGVSTWGRVLFFLSEQDDMTAPRPLDALREGDKEGVLRAARRFGDRGE